MRDARLAAGAPVSCRPGGTRLSLLLPQPPPIGGGGQGRGAGRGLGAAQRIGARAGPPLLSIGFVTLERRDAAMCFLSLCDSALSPSGHPRGNFPLLPAPGVSGTLKSTWAGNMDNFPAMCPCHSGKRPSTRAHEGTGRRITGAVSLGRLWPAVQEHEGQHPPTREPYPERPCPLEIAPQRCSSGPHPHMDRRGQGRRGRRWWRRPATPRLQGPKIPGTSRACSPVEVGGKNTTQIHASTNGR